MSDVRERVPVWTMGDRLRKSREKAGLKQTEMAAYLHKSRQAVGKWEDGAVVPDISTLRDWARRTGVPAEWLESGVGSQGGFAQVGVVGGAALALGLGATVAGHIGPTAAQALLYITDSRGSLPADSAPQIDDIEHPCPDWPEAPVVAGSAEAHLLAAA